MRSYDVVGYANTEEGYCICLDCINEADKDKFAPIFADSEWDYCPSCDVCHEAITGVSLTLSV